MSRIMDCDHSLAWNNILSVDVFYTGKIQAGQDRVFLFWDGLANYEEPQSMIQTPSIR
jgi:hypothetical protein